MNEPPEVNEALTILRLCDRFKCLPSQLLAEDARIFQYEEIERRVRGDG